MVWIGEWWGISKKSIAFFFVNNGVTLTEWPLKWNKKNHTNCQIKCCLMHACRHCFSFCTLKIDMFESHLTIDKYPQNSTETFIHFSMVKLFINANDTYYLFLYEVRLVCSGPCLLSLNQIQDGGNSPQQIVVIFLYECSAVSSKRTLFHVIERWQYSKLTQIDGADDL